MTITQKISIDLARPTILPPVAAVQGDTYTREVQISLYAAGVAWELPEGHDVAIRYSKSDGTAGVYDTLPDGSMAWQSEGNTVKIMLCPQMLTAPGMVPTQVSIILGDSIVSTFAFFVDVKADAGKGAMASENYVNWRSVYLPQLTGAKVGQYIEITEVDEKGYVLSFRAVDNPFVGSDIDMKGKMIDNIGVLSLAGPTGDAVDGAWMNIDDVVENEDGSRNPVINHYSNETDEPIILRNIAPGVKESDAATVAQVVAKLPQPVDGVNVGDYLKVAAVSEDGKTVTKLVRADPPRDGYTPVRGTDYWTDADKAEVKAYVQDKWEKIIDFTVPENTNSVEFTTDLNGNPFALKKALIYVSLNAMQDADGNYIIASYEPCVYLSVSEEPDYVATLRIPRPWEYAGSYSFGLVYAESLPGTGSMWITGCEAEKGDNNSGSKALRPIEIVTRNELMFPTSGGGEVNIKALRVGDDLTVHLGKGDKILVYGVRG